MFGCSDGLGVTAVTARRMFDRVVMSAMVIDRELPDHR